MCHMYRLSNNDLQTMGGNVRAPANHPRSANNETEIFAVSGSGLDSKMSKVDSAVQLLVAFSALFVTTKRVKVELTMSIVT